MFKLFEAEFSFKNPVNRFNHLASVIKSKPKLINILGRGSMYKDAGVMGGKIKSTLTSNPMMTSPAGLNPTSGIGATMFQPAAFQPSAGTTT